MLSNKYKKLPIQAKASLWFLICAFLQKGISVITTPIFTRLLSTIEYGQYNVFNSWLGIISIFVTLNLSYGIYTQGLIKFEEDRKAFSSSMQGLTCILVIGWMIIYLLFHSFWNKLFSLSTIQMLAMLVMIWTTAVFGFWSDEQRVLYKYKMLVIITLLVSFAKPVVGIILVSLFNDKVTARIIGLVLVELIGYSSFFFIQIKNGKKIYSAKYWRYAIAFNLPLIPHYLSQTVLNNADRIMINSIIGARESGIYSLAYSVSLIMTLFNTSLMSTISPWIYQKIKDKRTDQIAPVAYCTLILIAGVNLALIAFAPEVVRIFAPKSYYQAIYVIPPVAMSVYFMYAYDLFAKYAFYFEKTKFVMTASVLGALLNIVLNYFFIKRFGYIAAGYTTLICYIIYSICHYIFMNKVCDDCYDKVRPYSFNAILKITVPFIIGGFILLATYNYMVIRYMIIIICVFVVFIKRTLIYSSINKILDVRR